MKKLKSIGVILNRDEQKTINGGKFINCNSNPLCPPYNENSCIVYGNTCRYYC